MSVTFHTTAFVLRTINQGEHDRRAHLYSLDRGKLDVFIKSARKFASKLTPHVEPLTIVDCYVARGRIDHLAGVERLDRFSGVRGSLPRFAAAAWAAETVDLLTKWDHADPRIFHLLSSWCVFIDQLSTDRVSERLRLKFFLTLLSYLGYGLQWHACIKCRVSAHDYWAVQPTEGGVICGTCTADPLFSLAITNREREALEEMQQGAPSISNRESFRKLSEKKANAFITMLLQLHFDRPMGSERFLASVAPLSFFETSYAS